jgi:hypothetical protein
MEAIIRGQKVQTKAFKVKGIVSRRREVALRTNQDLKPEK